MLIRNKHPSRGIIPYFEARVVTRTCNPRVDNFADFTHVLRVEDPDHAYSTTMMYTTMVM
jgi:hypothetical protein